MKFWAIIVIGLFSIPAFGQDQTVVAPPADSETGCVKSTAFFYNDWLAFGKPACWCYPRNCRGDADGYWQGGVLCHGFKYVYTNDLNTLIAAWQIKEPPHGPGIQSVQWNGHDGVCSDFDRRKQGNPIMGYWRVGSNDLNILIANWNIREPPHGPGIPDCMDTGHYNFFMNPD